MVKANCSEGCLKDAYEGDMRLFLTSLFVLILASQPLSSQEIRLSLQQEIAQAYGYCTGQKLSIEKIQREHPALASSAVRAQLAFQLVFKRACESVEGELQKREQLL